jgi:hypothetical protein
LTLSYAEEQGWRVDETTKGFMFYPADRSKRPIAARRQPSDKGLIETLADLRAAGFIWPWPER